MSEFVNMLISKNLVHSIHTSERRSFRGCRRRWNWIFNDRYYPTVTPKPLEFGVAFHKGMEVLYDPMTWNDKETAAALAQAAFIKTTKEQYQSYLKLNKGNIDPEMKADYDERVLLGISMLKYYTKYVIPVQDNNFKPVKVEIEFEVPIKDPGGQYVWCKCLRCWNKWKVYVDQHNLTVAEEQKIAHAGGFTDDWHGLPVTYGGRIDALMEDELGRYWVFDWKTAARMSGVEPGSPDDYMLLDDQITSYCWALDQLGIAVAGFVYAEIKKAKAEEPEPNKTQRLGRWYSVNKQQNTTYEMYLDTVKTGDPTAYAQGLYDEFLQYLKDSGNRFHLRHQIHRNSIELKNAGLNIWLEARDITDPQLRIYPSAGRFSCNGCAFREPCLGMNRGEDYLYTLNTMFEKRERAYYEKEASTDSKGGE